MKGKITVLLFFVLSAIFTASAFIKASNKYAEKANTMVLCAYATGTGGSSEEEVAITVRGIHSDRWTMTIATEEDIIVSGVFRITNSYMVHDSPFIQATGLNDETGQIVKFDLSFSQKANNLVISFFGKDGEYFISPYHTFYVFNNDPSTYILLNKKTEYFELTDPDLKKATINQLKKCLANSPYMK